MKNHVVHLIFILASATVVAQTKFETTVSLGLGASIEKPFTFSERKNQMRIIGSVVGYYTINNRLAMGIELLASSKFLDYYRFGDSGRPEGYDPSTNTRILNYNNLNASSYLLNAKYIIGESTVLAPFVSAGLGVSKYVYRNVINEANAAKVSVVGALELGLSRNRLTFSCKAIIGGNTPSYTGFDQFSNSNVLLSSIRSNQIYVTCSYLFVRFPRHTGKSKESPLM